MEGRREGGDGDGSSGCGEVRLLDTSEELSTCLAEYIHQISEAAVMERGSFSLALSGGDIPMRLGRKLGSLPYLKTVEWRKWHVFWAEENVVPRRHPHNLYLQAKEAFISKVPIQPAQVISVGYCSPGEASANRYEFTIRQQVRNRTVPASPSSDCPRFDLVLLRLDPHGNVSSLYPNDQVLLDTQTMQWVASVSPGASAGADTHAGAPTESVTLTPTVINAAANVAIVASGGDVAGAFREAMVGRGPVGSIPGQMIRPVDGSLVWFVDSSAASLFSHGEEGARACASTSGP